MVPNRAKSSISRQNHEVVSVPKHGGTGNTIQNPFGTGTKTSDTGTTIHNVFGTGPKHIPQCPKAQIFVVSHI